MKITSYIESTKRINWRLYISLLFMGVCPAIYNTIRTYFVGQIPNEWSYSIAGQLQWVSLLYEIINEAIILPLFFFLGMKFLSKEEFTNRLKTGLLLSAIIFGIFSIIIIIFTNTLLHLMATSPEIIPASIPYIRLEAIANIFAVSYSFVGVALVVIGKDTYVYLLTGCKLLLSIILDILFLSNYSFSLQLGVNGIGVSNIISNILLVAIALYLINKEGYKIFNKRPLNFLWIHNLAKIGGISGLESFVRNIAYMLMVSRMVNMVGEQGTYWVANTFIWGWLLLPVLALGELIKKEVSEDISAISQKTKGYFILTGGIVLLWLIFIPWFKPFMQNILGFSDVDKLFNLVILLLGFYIFFAFQNIFDVIFYGRGKTNYMLVETIITNSIYYGGFFILYNTGNWEPTLYGIALMFGFGMVFDSIVSGAMFYYFLNKESQN